MTTELPTQAVLCIGSFPTFLCQDLILKNSTGWPKSMAKCLKVCQCSMSFNVSCAALCQSRQVFHSIMMCAFTWDFTQRAKAIPDTIQHAGANIWESRLAGRSARGFCWLAGLNSWVLWIAVVHAKEAEETQTMFYKEFYRNSLPWGTWVAPPLALTLFVLGTWRKCTALQADFAFSLFCSLPPVLLTLDFILVLASPEVRQSQFSARYDMFVWSFVPLCTAASIMAIQTLAQAGCHPLPCALATILVTCSYFPLCVASFGFLYLTKLYLVRRFTLVWLILLSHSLDYMARIRGIRDIDAVEGVELGASG